MALHSARQGFVKARIAQANQIRGLLAEFGLIVPQVIAHIATTLPNEIEGAARELLVSFLQLIERLIEHFEGLDKGLEELEAQIKGWHRANQTSGQIRKNTGYWPIDRQRAISLCRRCEKLRQLAAWLGLVPRQHSSGGRPTLLGMSKRGDTHLRTLMIHGSRSVIYRAGQKNDPESWLIKRCNINVAAVALTNKTARIVWALLAHKSEYQPDYRHSLRVA